MRYREFILVAGIPRSGKTYFSQKIANSFFRENNSILAYNAGMDSDFKDYTEIQFLDIEETAILITDKRKKRAYLNNPEICLFRIAGKIFNIKDLNYVIKKRKVKSYRLADVRSEDLLFKAFYLYLKDSLLILDDIRPVFRDGLKKGAISLLLRLNHAGIKSNIGDRLGVDVIAIFHNLDKINSELYDYASRLVLFKCTRKPDLSKVNNEEIEENISRAFDKISTMPVRHFCEIDIKENEVIFHEPIK